MPPRASSFFVTTPIYYVNARPHLGHLYSSVLADVRARWSRLKDEAAYLSTGTDEHGQKVRAVAREKGLHEQAWCDQVAESYKDLAHRGDIAYSRFIRTTDPDHKRAASALWQRLADREQIYRGKHSGWYAISDECFYSHDQTVVRDDPLTGRSERVSSETGKAVEWVEEDNWIFRLSEQQKPLLDWLHHSPNRIVPSARMLEVESYIQNGLSDLSISRPSSRLSWGIAVPNDPSQTIYVWIDALTNYLTVTGFPWTGREPAKSLGPVWPADVHFVGKDILRFHAVYWPALLIAADLAPPRQIVAHAHWTMEKQKMSKSLGNVADPIAMMDKFGSDAVRYYLCRFGGLLDDADYSESYLMTHYRKELAGQLGNLLSRVMAVRSRLSVATSTTVPSDAVGQPTAEEVELERELAELPLLVDRMMTKHDYPGALNAIFEVVHQANKAWSLAEPWNANVALDSATRAVQYALEALRVCGILLTPVMPNKTAELLDHLGVAANSRSFADAMLQWRPGQVASVGPSRALFPRIAPS